MASLYTLLLCTCFVFGSALARPPHTLRLVSLLYRHGDRSPVQIYPKDINQVSNAWPDGLGWLSNIGKQQQYELGQYLRQRYDGFLNTSYYHHDEILVESSAENRCLMSAYSNLAGLFPPKAAQLWNRSLKWQPIPVQTRPMDMDNKLAERTACPRYDELFQELLDSPVVEEEEERNKEFYEMVENNTGIKKESIKDIWAVADTLVCEKAHDLKWNPWVYEPGVWEKMNELRTMSFDMMYNTSAMTRLKGGPLLKEIISNMQAAMKKEQPMPKVYMYSAHDTTVASLLSAMHTFNRHQPMYRALVMVELHQIDTVFVVKIFYKNDTNAEPYELIPRGCSEPCVIEEFVEVTKDTVPVNWEEECKAQGSEFNTGPAHPDTKSVSPASWIALGVGVGLCLVLVATLVVMLVRSRKQKSGDSGGAYSKL